MTAWKRRTGKWIACWAAPARTLRWPPAFSRESKIVAVVGDDFAAGGCRICCRAAASIWKGLERVPGKTFFWAGVYSADMNDRTTLATDLNVFADFNPKLPESLPRGALPAAGQHPARPAAQRARADERRALRGRRHHELLDSRLSRRAAGHHPRVGFPADQRQRSAHAVGRAQPAARRREDSWTWVRTRW